VYSSFDEKPQNYIFFLLVGFVLELEREEESDGETMQKLSCFDASQYTKKRYFSIQFNFENSSYKYRKKCQFYSLQLLTLK
jgi:hypothetical protein